VTTSKSISKFDSYSPLRLGILSTCRLWRWHCNPRRRHRQPRQSYSNKHQCCQASACTSISHNGSAHLVKRLVSCTMSCLGCKIMRRLSWKRTQPAPTRPNDRLWYVNCCCRPYRVPSGLFPMLMPVPLHLMRTVTKPALAMPFLAMPRPPQSDTDTDTAVATTINATMVTGPQGGS
jgi:hypothetical protein